MARMPKISQRALTLLETKRAHAVLEPVSMCLNMLLVVVLSVIIALPWSHSDHVFNEGLKTLTTVKSTPAQDAFEDIETTDNFYTWARAKLVAPLMQHTDQSLAALKPGFNGDADRATPDLVANNGRFHFFPYGRTYLVGPIRLRQIRAQSAPCSYNGIRFVTLLCHEDESHNPYGPLPAFQWEQTQDRDYEGLLATYPSGGFSVMLSVNDTAETQVLTDLETLGWIDISTLAVFVNFNVYNANLNRVIAATLLMEQPASAGIVLSWKFRTYNLFPEADATEYSILVVSVVVLAAITVLLTIMEIRDIFKIRAAYFLSGWTWVDLTLITGLYTYFAFYTTRASLEPNVRDQALANDGRFLNMSELLYYERAERIGLMIACFALFVRFMRYSTLVPRVHKYLVMMSGVFASLMAFMVLYFFIFVAFAFVGHLMFRDDVESYSTLGRAMFANIALLLGNTDDYPEWVQSNRWFAYIFFLSFSILAIVFLFNLVITILGEAFSQREEESMYLVQATSEAVHAQLRVYWRKLTCGRAKVAAADGESAGLELDDDLADSDGGIAHPNGVSTQAQLESLADQMAMLQAQISVALATLPSDPHPSGRHSQSLNDNDDSHLDSESGSSSGRNGDVPTRGGSRHHGHQGHRAHHGTRAHY